MDTAEVFKKIKKGLARDRKRAVREQNTKIQTLRRGFTDVWKIASGREGMIQQILQNEQQAYGLHGVLNHLYKVCEDSGLEKGDVSEKGEN